MFPVWSTHFLQEYEDFAVNGLQKWAFCKISGFPQLYQTQYRWNRSEFKEIMNKKEIKKRVRFCNFEPAADCAELSWCCGHFLHLRRTTQQIFIFALSTYSKILHIRILARILIKSENGPQLSKMVQNGFLPVEIGSYLSK